MSVTTNHTSTFNTNSISILQQIQAIVLEINPETSSLKNCFQRIRKVAVGFRDLVLKRVMEVCVGYFGVLEGVELFNCCCGFDFLGYDEHRRCEL